MTHKVLIFSGEHNARLCSVCLVSKLYEPPPTLCVETRQITKYKTLSPCEALQWYGNIAKYIKKNLRITSEKPPCGAAKSQNPLSFLFFTLFMLEGADKNIKKRGCPVARP